MKIIMADDNIRLKEIDFSDVKTIFRLIDSQREYLGVWLPFVQETRTVFDTHNFVDDYLRNHPQDLTFIVFYFNQPVGMVGLRDSDSDNQRTEIGFWISEKYQHKGIISISCKALIKFLFSELDYNRIQLRAATNNLKSRAVAERLGFTIEGIERDGELHSNGFVDLVVYSILRRDFKSI